MTPTTEAKRYRAEFQGWKMDGLRTPVRGPFTVEVYRGGKGKWIAELLPGHRTIGSRQGLATSAEAKATVGANFEKQLIGWEAVQ